MKNVRCSACPWRLCGAFKPIDQEQLAFIEQMKTGQISFDPGSDVILPGATDPNLYTVFSGWACRYKELPDGRRQILNFLLPGDLVGVQSSMFSAALYGVSAITHVEMCHFPRARFWALFERMPELAFDVTWLASREESHVDEMLVSVGRRSATERLGALMLGLHRRMDALGLAENGAFALPLTQQQIADAMGLSLVHTNKSLAKLRRLGLFSWIDGQVRILNPLAMESLASFAEVEFAPRPLI